MLSILFLNGCHLSLAWADWEAQGNVRIFNSQSLHLHSTEFSTKSSGLEFNPQLQGKWGSSGRLKVNGRVSVDGAAKDSSERLRIQERNFFLQASKKSFSARLGIQDLTMPGPDILNPMDVIHPKDFKNPLAPVELGSLGLSAGQNFESWNYSVLYIPLQTPPRLPGEKSIWWPRKKRLPLDYEFVDEARIPENVEYRIQGPIEVDRARKDNFAILSSYIGLDFETHFLIYEGLSLDPQLLFNASSTNFVLESPIELIPFYYRHRVIANSWVIPMGNWSFKASGSLKSPLKSKMYVAGRTNPIVEGSESTGVIGVEKNIDSKGGFLTIILQKTWEKRESSNQISFLRSVFENAWNFAIRYPLNEQNQILAGLVYDSVGKSSITQLSYTFRISDQWSLDAHLQFLEGKDTTMVGLYRNYDQGALKMTYNF
jgi:hypothetical protein